LLGTLQLSFLGLAEVVVVADVVLLLAQSEAPVFVQWNLEEVGEERGVG
jgi:hypothetical protein